MTCLDLYGNHAIDAAMLFKIHSLVRLQPQHKATAALVCWNRRRHTIFGGLVNKVFASFLLRFIRVVCTDNSAVRDADPEMVEETTLLFHHVMITTQPSINRDIATINYHLPRRPF